jgi:transcription elongation factor Elf1
MFNLNYLWIDFNCPKCSYNDTVQFIDAKTERTVYCHNCKTSIKLNDSDASVHHGIQKINNSVKQLENLLKKFGK